MNNTFERNKEGYSYISKNGIVYDLYEGMTIGGEKRYTSAMLFIMLYAITNVQEEHLYLFSDKFDNEGILFVNWVSFPSELDDYTKEYIREIVDDFEKEHADIVEFVKKHQIKKTVEVTMEVTYRVSLDYKVTRDEYEDIQAGLLPTEIQKSIKATIKDCPETCDVETDWAATDKETDKQLQDWRG